MAYIKEYWNGKEQRAREAKEHTAKMERKYQDFIKKAIENTRCYSTDFKIREKSCNENMKLIVDDIDSVSAIMKYKKDNGRMAVLNFASYKNPGGMFINGSKAQEECLCHESFLYNVLKEKEEYYEWNNKHKNKSLYLNRALYSPNILFIKKGKYNEELKYCDVITCAAPNKSAAQKYLNVSNEENTKALTDRIRFLLDVASDNDAKTLILGGYGCGVFGQEPKEVAHIFKETLKQYDFELVVFAIPDGKNTNLKSFRETFKERK